MGVRSGPVKDPLRDGCEEQLVAPRMLRSLAYEMGERWTVDENTTALAVTGVSLSAQIQVASYSCISDSRTGHGFRLNEGVSGGFTRPVRGGR